jgi:hypothetical protein
MSDEAKFGEPGYQAAAAEAVSAAVTPDQGVDAGESVEAMQQAAVRAAMSDYEKQLKDMMAAAEAQNAQWAKQFSLMQRQLATVQAQAGPPVSALLAQSLAQRVKSIAIANPDLGMAHFSGIIGQTETLADEVKALAGGDDSASADTVERLAHSVETWFTRTHARISGKVLEGAGAALDEAERLVDELPNLVPVAMGAAGVLAKVV